MTLYSRRHWMLVKMFSQPGQWRAGRAWWPEASTILTASEDELRARYAICRASGDHSLVRGFHVSALPGGSGTAFLWRISEDRRITRSVQFDRIPVGESRAADVRLTTYGRELMAERCSLRTRAIVVPVRLVAGASQQRAATADLNQLVVTLVDTRSGRCRAGR